MTLVSYETTNWGPHKHQRVVFPTGAKTVALCAENDQGKSWIVRGIGFCLSIGRNEYGDQSAIHDGETEASHKLVIEHKGETHTIEKIVRSKKSEDEGTQTLIDGEAVTGSGYERFYSETLGLPHPSIWLPIVIAMQNETDFHLRRKKSEREEALRAACQLTRIDNWKMALQTRVNEEDKMLLAQEAGLKAKQGTLERDLQELNKEKTVLEGILAGCSRPCGEEGPELAEIMVSVEAYGKAEAAMTKAALEHGNLRREFDLATNALERTKLELAKLPGGSPEEENKTAEWAEALQAETEAREKKLLNAKLAERLKASAQKQKELAETQKTGNPETVASLEETLAEISKKRALIEEKEREAKVALEEAGTPATAPDLWPEEAERAQKAAAEKTEAAGELATEGRAYESAMEEAKRLCPEETREPENLEKTKEALEAALADCSGFGEGPLKGPESKTILARVLGHWDEHPHETCPICDRTMEGLRTFQNPKARKAVLEALQAETESKEELETRRKNATLSLRAIETGTRARKALQTLAGKEWREWASAAETKTKEAASSRKTATSLTEAIKARKAAENERATLASLTERLKGIHEGAPDPEKGQELLKKLREAVAKRGILEAELASLERETAHLEESCTKLAEAGEPSETPELTALGPETLKAALEEAKAKNRKFREARATRAELEKSLASAKTKAQATEAALTKMAEEIKRLDKEIEEGCGMPEAKPGDTPSERAAHWRKVAEEAFETKIRLGGLPGKIAEKTAETELTARDLEKTAKAAAKASAARRLVAFLDYKNAPRKLLVNICERLFEATNRIAEILQADIRLKVGKNLDFLTLQYRAGRLIEQKTERLGFGKGAVLGICFRLACQKLLLPETGFLILDEPTANVDVKRKDALKTFLQKLGDETESKTKQVILIEHDLNVIELCQAKIQIGEEKP